VQRAAAWRDAYVAILLSRPIIDGGTYHQDYMRILPLRDVDQLVSPIYNACPDERLRMRAIWGGLPQLQHVFRYFHQGADNQERGRQGQRNADVLTHFLPKLAA
jgi:hypothetical protein